MNVTASRFIERLKAFALSKGAETQEDAAALFGVSRSQYSQVITLSHDGYRLLKKPNAAMLEALGLTYIKHSEDLFKRVEK